MNDSDYIKVPFPEVVKATFDALKELGGSGSNQQINEKAAALCKDAHPGKTIDRARPNGQSELEYHIAWARTYLKDYGLLENIARGAWAIVPGKHDQIDADEVVKDRYAKWRNSKTSSGHEIRPGDNESDPGGGEIESKEDTGEAWRNNLLDVLTNLSPDAFERLTQRLLMACNFTDVEVTGKAGDGGIDGTATAKINDLLSFSVVFQCKRYALGNPVGIKDIQAFRGSLMTRAERGLFVTTSYFTKAAREEAMRAGVAPIDLMDADLLTDKLKELNLGVETKIETVQRVTITINESWYEDI